MLIPIFAFLAFAALALVVLFFLRPPNLGDFAGLTAVHRNPRSIFETRRAGLA